MREHPSTSADVALADAAEAFAHWRATRRRGREPTPEPLRAVAVALLDAHRPATITRALAISPVALSRWAEEIESDPPSLADAFVTLPPATTPEAEPLEPATAELVLRWPHGVELVARGPISPATLAAILATVRSAPPPSSS